MTIFTKRKNAVVTGRQIYLRPLVPDDGTPEYLSWLKDPETTKYLELNYQKSTIAELREDIAFYNRQPDVRFYAICMKDGTHIGNIKIENINEKHGFGELGFLIGREYWGNGYATEAVKLMCQHLFDSFWLRRIVAGYYDDNEGSRRIFEKNGFEVEGILKEHRWSPSSDKWVDEYRVALTNGH